MLVTTPEKWDVVTRKSVGDVALSQIVRLLILDEVHLLHEDRGPVLESLVARTIRQVGPTSAVLSLEICLRFWMIVSLDFKLVLRFKSEKVESTQSMIRILGLSATLPNYLDVASFLHVNPYIGLFFFDSRFRPVPLGQTFVGVKATNKIQQLHDMEEICYNKVLEQVKDGHQVMVFVHARNATVRTAMGLIEMAKNHGEIGFFQPNQGADYGHCEKQFWEMSPCDWFLRREDSAVEIQRSRNKEMKEMFPEGFGIHHAGMLRSDRSMMESMFSKGYLKVLVCTATLAWGVNLPAHAVIIKGTQIYDAKRGTLVDLGILDVMQIFGRAGRPQFDKYGEGTIITTHDKLSHYLTLLTQQNPIESQFLDRLADNLNAEIALGTVTNVEEAVKWLSYTYLFVRMRANPLAYGINHKAYQMDPSLMLYRKELVVEAGRKLDKARMIRFEERTGYYASTDMGRTASHFYIRYNTIEIIHHRGTLTAPSDTTPSRYTHCSSDTTPSRYTHCSIRYYTIRYYTIEVLHHGDTTPWRYTHCSIRYYTIRYYTMEVHSLLHQILHHRGTLTAPSDTTPSDTTPWRYTHCSIRYYTIEVHSLLHQILHHRGTLTAPSGTTPSRYTHCSIRYYTIETFNDMFNSQRTEADILSIVSKAEEFDQLKVRDEELEELDQLLSNYCELPAAGGVENGYGKINVLLQTYISRGEVDSFSLISDLGYVAQNSARIVRALFEIALRKRWPAMTYRLLTLCKVIDKRLWGFAHPLRQFPNLSHLVLNRLEEKKLTVDKLKEMRKDEIGHMLHHVNVGQSVKQCAHQIPAITMEANIQPITRTVLRVRLVITPDFRWHDQVHGSVGEPWWLWVEDPINDHIYHSEHILLQKKQVVSEEPQHIVFTIPIFEPLPSQYYIRAVSDRWLGAEAVCIINFQNLILPERHPPHTGTHTLTHTHL
ncbi:Activating signal cointegrator 1 complex subunit 3 [Dissostichus eleginoides]|uniref:Activating signal cointegrator 1 complex subunit 3 n=1 Tax=Dissostichus eleginoides TaxID=100907 RepID=A0AAD9C861_DISEL|nr:Activating signal cointegrator 1 complex subunit 3 [Dissostichus eleginoides]